MSVPAPHYHLISEVALSPAATPDRSTAGQWRFILQGDDGRTCLEATDDEAQASAERLELLAIIRGLESLDEPARVTLATPSPTVRRSLRQGLERWRENDWHWERYGKLTPVKNGDLWRRIDRAMSIHTVQCQGSQLDATDDLVAPGAESGPQIVLSRRHLGGKRIRIDAGDGGAALAKSASASEVGSRKFGFRRRGSWFLCLLERFAALLPRG